jgi:hypothetical protein
MEKIDRLGWAVGTVFESYGVRVGVRATSTSALQALRERLPPGARERPARLVERLYSLQAAPPASRAGRVRRFHLLYGDIARLARTLSLEEALDAFERDLHLYVAAEARRRLFVHAGVVGWRGRAILLPGRSFTGKSTLVAELVRAGAVYYSDEYAVLDPSGRVHPFARPLQLREDETGRQRRVTVESLRGKNGVKPLPVGLVVAARFRAGARWRPRALTAGQGLLELLSNTVAARQRPEAALDTLGRVTASAAVFRGARGEAREMVRFILAAAS